MDTTTVAISLGVITSMAYVLLRMYKGMSFELNHTILIFLAMFSIPGGIELIAAGIIGKATSLPSSWREHVTVAGIVAIGLAAHYLFTAFQECRQIESAKTKQNLPASGGESSG